MNRFHGFSRKPRHSLEYRTYTCWASMKERCKKTERNSVANASYYRNNISVCDRWINSFANFLLDMGIKPTHNHSIDRINNNGNYEPSNCRWALPKTQANNRSDNAILSFNGESMTMAQWAERLEKPFYIIQRRLSDGWTVDRALTEKIGPSKTWPKSIEINKKMVPLKDLAEKCGITVPQIHKRLSRGWDIEKCLSEPLAEFHRVTPDELEYNGERLKTTEWAKRLGITSEELRRRLSRGWTVERAVTQKPKRSLDNPKNVD